MTYLRASAAWRRVRYHLDGLLKDRLTPVLESYDFDVQGIESEGTPAESPSASRLHQRRRLKTRPPVIDVCS